MDSPAVVKVIRIDGAARRESVVVLISTTSSTCCGISLRMMARHVFWLDLDNIHLADS